jgi:zinc transport system permease protein
MIGDGLSHVAFASLAIGSAMSVAPMVLTVPVVLVAAFILLRLNEKGKLKGDALTAIISTGALAIGTVAVSLSPGSNIDLNGYMFGSILALSESDVVVSVLLFAVVVPIYTVLYNKIFAVTFDPSFAKATGVKVGVYDTVLALLSALTIVVGMRFMGALLISALIVFPPMTAMRIMRSFKGVVICSALLPTVSFVIGLTASYFLSTPAGASVVCVSLVIFIISCIIGAIRKARGKSK